MEFRKSLFNFCVERNEGSFIIRWLAALRDRDKRVSVLWVIPGIE